MWLKILKYAAQAAIMLGLDRKLKSWLKDKLSKAEVKLDDKIEDVRDKVNEMGDPDD